MQQAAKDFLKTLSEAEWNAAEQIASLAHMLCSRLTEDTEFLFVRAAIERMRANPSAKSGELINVGLGEIGEPLIDYTLKQKKAPPEAQGAGRLVGRPKLIKVDVTDGRGLGGAKNKTVSVETRIPNILAFRDTPGFAYLLMAANPDAPVSMFCVRC